MEPYSERNGGGAARERRRVRWLAAACGVLALIGVLQSVWLVHLSRRRAAERALMQGAPDPASYAEPQPVRHPVDNQVVYWEATEDLDSVRDRILCLFREWAGEPAERPPAGAAPATRPPRNAARALSELQVEIERLLDDAVRQHSARELPARLHGGWDQAAPGAAIHIESGRSNYLVCISLPHCDPADIRAFLDGALLTIAAPPRGPGGPAAPLETRIRLPNDLDSDSVRAEYRDGMLHVRALRGASNSLVRPLAIH